MSKRIELPELLARIKKESYPEKAGEILRLIEQEKLKPVKRSGTNGKKPALYNRYWVIEAAPDHTELIEELKYQLDLSIDVSYYLAHPAIYQTERRAVRSFSDFLKHRRDRLNVGISLNERSFQIWGEEKFLSKGPGRKILSHCGWRLEDLNLYSTTEPLAYYVHTKATPKNILILENKDPFYSMRKHLLDGHDQILGMDVGALIYGAGKGILRSFQDFTLCVEPHMAAAENTIYYFGDLDYEGLGIFENLAGLFAGKQEIIPFAPAYRQMLDKAAKLEQAGDRLPPTSEQQNRRLKGLFATYFDEWTWTQMERLLRSERYIPQEILNVTDF